MSIKSLVLASLALNMLATATPLLRRQAEACFVIGSDVLPEEVVDTVNAIKSAVTCSTTAKTISNVPDVSSGSQTFSDISFATSGQAPLAFALSQFAAATPLADSSLEKFQDMLNVYQATEAGIRSVGGSLAIKAPKFFLSFQIARIKTAQGIAITEPGQTVQHLLGKVTKNAGSAETAETLATINALATQLT